MLSDKQTSSDLSDSQAKKSGTDVDSMYFWWFLLRKETYYTNFLDDFVAKTKPFHKSYISVV